MTTLLRTAVLGLLLIAVGCATVQPGTSVDDDKRQILITLTDDSTHTVQPVMGNPSGYHRKQRSQYQVSARVDHLIDQVARTYGLKRIKGWPIGPIGVYCEVLTVPEGLEIKQVIQRLEADPVIETAQRVNQFSVLSNGYDDPYLELQHGLTHMNVLEAHKVASGQGVRIAVIDTMIDKNHLELKHSVQLTRDFAANRANPESEKHGTAVAGVIASNAGNMAGIVGVAPNAEIVGLRACWRVASKNGSTCDSFSLAQAITFAIEDDVQIINMSLGGPHDPLLERLIKHAVGQGTIVVAAAGGAKGQSAFPGSMSEVLAVQTADLKDQRSVIFAPGVDVLTTMPNGAYDFVSGSSFAAAHVSGVIALLLEHNPKLDVETIRKMLMEPGIQRPLDACEVIANLIPKKSCGTIG